MDCPKCGQTLVEGDSVCWQCGYDMKSGTKAEDINKQEKVSVEWNARKPGIMPQLKWANILIASAILAALGIGFFTLVDVSDFVESAEDKVWEAESLVKRASKGELLNPPAHVNRLKSYSEGPGGVEYIPVNQPIELDFKTKEEVYEIRKRYVSQKSDLIEGEYRPSDIVFGQIEDGRPWWGLMGQFCNGNGQKSVEGESEESRFIANPFLLLGLDEGTAYIVEGPCQPIYPKVQTLKWYLGKPMAEVTYDYSRFMQQKKTAKVFDTSKITMDLVNYNARDFGYTYLMADMTRSSNVERAPDSMLFDEPSTLKNYIHRGGSCGYQGGCNNASPFDKDKIFKVVRTPAAIHVKLWREKPASRNQNADFTYIINMR